MTTPRWITVEKAAEVEGSASLKAFQEWVRRWNLNTENAHKVKRRHGKVELNSLVAALDEDAERFNDGERIQAAYQALSRNLSGAGRHRKSTATNQKGERP